MYNCLKNGDLVQNIDEVFMMKIRRLKWLGVFMMMLLFVLIGRLVDIQLWNTESFSKHQVNLIEASVKQRSQVLTVDDGRGKFYDRDGEPLTHEEKQVLVLFPFLKKMEWPADEVASILGIREDQLRQEILNQKKPFAFGGNQPLELNEYQSKAINNLKIPGVFAVKQKFNSQTMLAGQLLGLTVQYSSLPKERYPDLELLPDTRVGDKGLQRTFDEFLLSSGESKLVFHVDANGGPMFGVDVKYVEPANPLYPVKVITTLDKELQETAEKIVDNYQIKKGGLILLDIEKSEILASVSRPVLDKMQPNGSGAINHMFTQHVPGSVFKTIIAAAAIDYESAPPQRMFDCNQTIDGKEEKQRPLGMLNFQNSFSQSCNRAFAEVSQEIAKKDANFFETYADKLAITQYSGWQGNLYHSAFKQLYGEQSGTIWKDQAELKKDPKMIAKTAIGQLNVQVTPLAVANMMATIARGGEKQMVKAVKKVEFNNGTSAIDFPKKEIDQNTISPYTAMKLQELLRSVVNEPKGTGASLKDLPYTVAGKSGTAQINITEGKLNKWFAGYFPYENPKYALVAVNLDTTENTRGMVAVFAEMVKAIYTMNHENSSKEG